MNDDELTTNAELASAYLDGELEATRRAEVADDPATMAIVRSFDRVRTELRSPVPIDDDARASAVAAALAEFDSVRAAQAARGGEVAGTVRSLEAHRRVRGYRLVKALAAAAVAVVVGVVAVNASRENDTSTASESTAAPADAPVLKSTENAAGAAPSATLAAATAADSGGFAIPTIDSADALAEYVASFEGTRNATAAAAPAAPGTTAAAAQPPTAEHTSSVLALPPCLSPNLTVIGGEISFRGTPAFAVRDSTTGDVQAIGAVDCRVLTSASP